MSPGLTPSPPIPLADGEADTLRGLVRRGDRVHKLTEIERRLLRYLHDHAHDVLTRQQLHVDVWEYAPTVRSRAADHTIARLRVKIEVDPAQPQLLQTVHGVGYRWVPPTPVEGVAPVRSGELVGRDDDLAALRRAVAEHAHVAVVGPVGVGTSALAAQLGWRTIDMGGAASLHEVLARVAAALGVPARTEWTPASLAAVVARRPVCLDDLEVALPAVWSAWREARVVVTSRCRQPGVGHTLVVSPLARDAAVALLRRRVTAAGASAPQWAADDALDEVAARADGLPLALEVLGAQATWLGPAQLMARLDAAPAVVLEGSDALMRSVGGAVAALGDAERRLLERLSVFASAPLEAVERLGSLAALRALMERSLVLPDPRPGELRYRVLRPVSDVVRAWSVDDLAEARSDHAAWVRDEALARAGHPCHDVLDPTWWRAHLPELRRAVDHVPAPADRARLALSMVRLVSFAWLADPLPWIARAVDAAEAADDDDLRCAARAMRARFDAADPEGDLDAAEALARTPRLRAMVLHHRALAAVDARRYPQAEAWSREAYDAFVAADCARGAVDTLFPRIDALHATGQGEAAEAASTEAIRLARALDDPRGLGIAYATRGYAAETFAQTLADQQRALDVLEAVGDINAAIRIRLGRARLQAMAGFPCEPLGPLVAWTDELGQPRLAERARLEAAAAALHRGDIEAMAHWLEGLEAAAARDGFGTLFGCLAVAQGDATRGARLLRAEALAEATSHPTTGFFYAAATLATDEEGAWGPAIDRFEGLVQACDRFGPFTRFVGHYRQVVAVFRASVHVARGAPRAAREALAMAEALPSALPLWTQTLPAWRALVSGEALPVVPAHPEGWVLRAMASRR